MVRSLPTRIGVLMLVTMLANVSYWVFVGRHAQDIGYHNFADQRTMLGLPHAMNVLSNLPFIMVGIAGLIFMRSSRSRRTGIFLDEDERLPYWIYFLGLIFTGLGSMFYHAHPTNETLTWDRMFLAITFMALFSAMLAERVHVWCARYLLWPLIIFGAASVLYWQYSERIEQGDLRFYFSAQFFPLLALPLMLLLYPPRYSGTGDLVAMLLAYGLAKVVEILDRELYAGSGFVSGHTLKHLIAGLAAGLVLVMLSRRNPSRTTSSSTAPTARPVTP